MYRVITWNEQGRQTNYHDVDTKSAKKARRIISEQYPDTPILAVVYRNDDILSTDMG